MKIEMGKAYVYDSKGKATGKADRVARDIIVPLRKMKARFLVYTPVKDVWRFRREYRIGKAPVVTSYLIDEEHALVLRKDEYKAYKDAFGDIGMEYIMEEEMEIEKPGDAHHQNIMSGGFRLEKYLYEQRPEVVVITDLYEFIVSYNLAPPRLERGMGAWFKIKFVEGLKEMVRREFDWDENYKFSIIFCTDISKYKDVEETLLKLLFDEGDVELEKLDKVDED